MSYYSHTYASLNGQAASSLTAEASDNSGMPNRPVLFSVLVTVFEAFHEAMEMRRAAYRCYRFPTSEPERRPCSAAAGAADLIQG
jgi:hypothetical protein